MSKFQEIVDGWSNLLTGNEKELAEERAKICAECPFNKMNICSSCGCFIPAKTASPKSNCPKNYWLK